MAQSTYKQGSATLTVFLDPVCFELSQGSYVLQQKLLSALERFGLRLEEIHETGSFSGPANWALSMRFWSYRAELQMKVNRYELTLLNPSRDELEEVTRIPQSIEEAINEWKSDVTMKSRHVVYYGHYEVPNGFQALTSRFTGGIPEQLGTVTGNGLSLYVKDPSFTGEGTVVLDKSVLVPDGLFLTTRCSFDHEFDLRQSVGNFYAFLTRVLELFDLRDK